MNKTIAIGMLGLVLGSSAAGAQSTAERARILRDFQQSVVDYTQRPQCLDLFPEAIDAATPAPQVFTLPVAMVFRQLIAAATARHEGGTAISGTVTTHHPTVLQPMPGHELADFPTVLSEALPALPAPLEYRLVGNDLVIRDAGGDVVVAVLRDALGGHVTRR
jgi:hypothetical protein